MTLQLCSAYGDKGTCDDALHPQPEHVRLHLKSTNFRLHSYGLMHVNMFHSSLLRQGMPDAQPLEEIILAQNLPKWKILHSLLEWLKQYRGCTIHSLSYRTITIHSWMSKRWHKHRERRPDQFRVVRLVTWVKPCVSPPLAAQILGPSHFLRLDFFCRMAFSIPNIPSLW